MKDLLNNLNVGDITSSAQGLTDTVREVAGNPLEQLSGLADGNMLETVSNLAENPLGAVQEHLGGLGGVEQLQNLAENPLGAVQEHLGGLGGVEQLQGMAEKLNVGSLTEAAGNLGGIGDLLGNLLGGFFGKK